MTEYGPFDIGFISLFYGRNRQFYLNTMASCRSRRLSVPLLQRHAAHPARPDNLVAMFWDDLTFAAGRPPGPTADTLVASSACPAVSGGPYTFQTILRADGTVTLQYLDMRPG
jgi:hypothetical protein